MTEAPHHLLRTFSVLETRWRTTLLHLWIIAIYAAISLMFLNPSLVYGFGNYPFSNTSGDPQLYVWGLAWYPYALTHGLDLFFSRVVFSPAGFNLVWSTTIPGASLILGPVTRHFGPIVSFNLLSLLAPVTSAYVAFALCNILTRATLPSLVGGFVYGFSAYQQFENANLDLALSFVVPLVSMLFILRVENRISRRAFSILFAACLFFQILNSPEILATSTLFAALALFLGWRLGGERWRMRAGGAIREAVGVFAIVILAMIPYFLRFLPSPFGFLPIYNPAHCSIDLLNFVVPTPTSLAGLHAMRSTVANFKAGTEPIGYMGLLPFLALWALLSSRRSAGEAAVAIRVLALLLLIVCIMALGPVIRFDGIAIAPGPWLFAMLVPILNNALPARFMLFAFLLSGIVFAVWLSERTRGSTVRWIVGTLTMLSILPSPTVPERGETPPFFSQGLYRRYLSEGDSILILPYESNGDAMLSQAESGFFFRMAGGSLGIVPEEYRAWPIVPVLLADTPDILGYRDQFGAFLAAHDVRAVIVGEAQYPRYASLCSGLGVEPAHVGGVVLFKLESAALDMLRHLTAAEMDTRYNVERFPILIGAARAFLASGNPLDALNPASIRQRGLLSAAIAGDTPRWQTSGYPLVARLRSSRTFQAAIAFVMSRLRVRERLAEELGPFGPGSATSSGVWLGMAPDDSIAIGVVAGTTAAAALRNRFGALATAIYYPYPLPYGYQTPALDDRQLIMMVFRRDQILNARELRNGAVVQQPPPTTQQTPVVPPMGSTSG